MRLSSSAFADGAAIPRRFTCDGEDLSPPLSWSYAPTATRSFVLLCDDPDAPAGTWHHWALHDIPSTLTALAENAASDAENRSRRSMIFSDAATAAHAHRAAMGRIIIIFGCSRFQSSVYRSVEHHPVVRSSVRPASTSSPKQL